MPIDGPRAGTPRADGGEGLSWLLAAAGIFRLPPLAAAHTTAPGMGEFASGLCAGGFVVLARPWPTWLLIAMGAAVALDSGVDAGTSGIATVKILFATWVSLIVFVVNAAFYVSVLPRLQWVQTGVRVAGSWVAAIALLMMAFALRR